MKSRTSCFEPMLFRKNLKKTAPIYVLFLLAFIYLLPVMLLTTRAGSYSALYENPSVDLANQILQNLNMVDGLICFFYALLAAWVLFFWTFRTNTAYFYGSLPIKRNCLFLTNYLSGLVIFVVPMAIICLLTYGATCILAFPQAKACWVLFYTASLCYFHFFSFAVLLISIIGHMAAMPVFYGILSFAPYVLYYIVTQLCSTLLYGMPVDYSSGLSEFFTPVIHLLSDFGYHITYADNGIIQGVEYFGLNYVWYLAGAGVLFAVLAMLLLRKREYERCGEVIAIRALKPVFLYAFTLGCSVVIGFLLMTAFNTVNINFAIRMLCLLLGAAIGYFGARMMLEKSLKVFSGKIWLGFICVALVLVAFFGAMQLDLFGYSKRIPAAEDVAAVSVRFNGRSTKNDLTDADQIQAICYLHHEILDNRTELERAEQGSIDWWNEITLTYTLKNGQTLTRTYELYATEDMSENCSALFETIDEILNSEAIRRDMIEMDIQQSDIPMLGCEVWSNSGETDFTVTGKDAYALYEAAIRDIETSSIGSFNINLPSTDDASIDGYYLDFALFVDHASFQTGTASWYDGFEVPPDAGNTMAVIEALMAENGYHDN